MDLTTFYDQTYLLNSNEYSPNYSLINFINNTIPKYNFKNKIEVLEVGCGDGSIFESIHGLSFNVLGVDFSQEAINKAKSRNIAEFDFIHSDFSNDLILEKKFDLILDSHCLHCVTELEKRKIFLKNIYNHLSNSGIFMAEVMVSHNEMQFADNFLFNNEQNTLLQQIEGTVLPVRYIPNVKQVEDELLEVGFKINYLRAFPDFKIIPDATRSVAYNEDPELLRFICQK